ncbi:MAG: chromosomal replication initiator protein DnaA [Patescibacteria group bacterium]
MDKENLWKATLEKLRLDLSSANYKTWFLGTTILEKEGPEIKIGCTSPYTKERLQKHYQTRIKTIVDELTGEDTNLKFYVKRKKTPQDKLGPLFTESEEKKKQFIQQSKKSNLFPQYTFDNFVVGNNNNLAFAVAQGIVEEPGTRHNPFFLYSKVGLGKTHLTQAIGNEIIKKHQDKNVLYTTSENFTNQLVKAIKNSTTTKFHQRFRSVDVLLIDDIQFFAGRESSQEELFHTFNTLFMEQKQIVLTSDRPLTEISKLEERLSSRFGSGMIADMQTPDIDIRLAILRQKRETRKLNISNKALEYIAEAVPSNIRELEGALNQVITVAKAQNKEPDLEIAKEVLGNLEPKKPVSPGEIIKEICNYYTVKPKELRGPRRPARIAHPRQVAMYFLRKMTDMSLEEVGDLLGGRDHTTVIHGVNKIEQQIEDKLRIKEQIMGIKDNLSE